MTRPNEAIENAETRVGPRVPHPQGTKRTLNTTCSSTSPHFITTILLAIHLLQSTAQNAYEDRCPTHSYVLCCDLLHGSERQMGRVRRVGVSIRHWARSDNFYLYNSATTMNLASSSVPDGQIYVAVGKPRTVPAGRSSSKWCWSCDAT